MPRSALAFALCTAFVFATTATALASESGHDGGEGWYGLTTDKIVTNFGFALIAFFPLFVLTMSLLQHNLDKRKKRRQAAAKAHGTSGHWAGGW